MDVERQGDLSRAIACKDCGKERPVNHVGLCWSCEADRQDELDVQRGRKEHPED